MTVQARPRCVFITTFAPLPRVGGSYTRAAATVAALAVDYDVTVVVLTRAPAGPDTPRHIAASAKYCGKLGARVVAIDEIAHNRWTRNGHLLSGGTGRGWEHRLVGSAPAPIEELVADADLVWVFKMSSFLLISVPRHPALMVDLDDLNERVMSRERLRDRLRIWMFVGHRRRVMRRARRALVCSELDRGRLGATARVAVLHNTAPEPVGSTERAVQGPVVLMVGSMGYHPNAEGVRWFAEQVWPQIHRARPDAVFRVAGSHGKFSIDDLDSADGVDILGYVDDLDAELRIATVCIAPLFTGSGTRVKILEAFAWGIPVVATTLGAEGIDAQPGEHLLLADEPADFAVAVIDILDDPDKAKQLGENGRILYGDRYSPDAFTQRVSAIAAGALSPS